MTLLFRCKKCGAEAPTLEGHRCAPRDDDGPALKRRLAMEAGPSVFPEAFTRDGVLKDGPASAAEGRFDRNAYHKAYMKTYMRGWRARKRALNPT